MKMPANLLNFKLIFGARHLLVMDIFFVEYVVVGSGCMFETMKQRHNGIGCAFFWLTLMIGGHIHKVPYSLFRL